MIGTPLRDRLVQAGVELLEEEGLANLTLRAIARRTGVSHGAPRRYFPTHNSLLAAIAATGLADLATRLHPPDPAAGVQPADRAASLQPVDRAAGVQSADRARRRQAEAQLVEAAQRYLEFAAERPGMFELLFRHDLLEGAGGNLRAKSLPLFQSFADLVEQARPGSTDARERAIVLWTNIHGLATLRATRALDLLGTSDLTPLVTHTVHVHLS